MAKCEVCGRHLRTGRKYCYEHKSRGKSRGSVGKFKDLGIKEYVAIFLGIFMMFFLAGFVIYVGIMSGNNFNIFLSIMGSIFILMFLRYLIPQMIRRIKIDLKLKKNWNRDRKIIEDEILAH